MGSRDCLLQGEAPSLQGEKGSRFAGLQGEGSRRDEGRVQAVLGQVAQRKKCASLREGCLKGSQ